MAIARKPADHVLNDWPQLLDGLQRAEKRINDWTQSPQAFLTLLGKVLGPPPTPQPTPKAWLELRTTLQEGRLQPDLEIREDWEMPGLAGAYQAPTASHPQGRILLNRQWLRSADASAVEAVVLEEFGHAIDRTLHGQRDTAGDEGERLSALLRGQRPSSGSSRENDRRELRIDGQVIRVEGSIAATLPAITLSHLTATGTTAPARTAFGGSTILLDSGLSLGATPEQKALVIFGRGYVKNEDELVVVGTLPTTITATFDKDRGILSLEAINGGNPSQDEWRDALRSIGYRNLKTSANPPQTPTAGDRELVITSGKLPAFYINGQAHFYERKETPTTGDSNRWLRAKNEATTSTYAGLTGYLGTITSAEENAFITRALLPTTGRTWLGGSDAGTEGQWKWDAGSTSPENPGTTFSQTVAGNSTSKAVTGKYVNWKSGEGTGSLDDYLSIDNAGQWSDDKEGNQEPGYLVEFSPTTGTPDSAQRITIKPVAAASDQTFSVIDYTTQAIQGTGTSTSYTLTNATVELSLFGGSTLKVKATSVTISNGKIVSLKGSGKASSLYGLTDVDLTAINISSTTRTISGKATLGGQQVNLNGNLKLESNGRYSFADLTGSLSDEQLKKLIPEDGYLTQARNGSFGFKRNSAGDSLDVGIKGIASFDARPDLADISAPFDVRLANGLISNGKLSTMDLQRVGTTPWKLKLGEHEMTVNGETIKYKREVEIPAVSSSDPATTKHLYTLDLNGDLRQTGGDVIKVDGLLSYGSAIKGSEPLKLLPTVATFDILNTTPFTVGTTQLKPGGGLKLRYQEDSQRKYGLLDVSGEATIDLEILKDIEISLGKEGQDVSLLMQAQAGNLRATDWGLGNLSNEATASASGKDLGLAKYSSVKIEPGSSIPTPRFYDSANLSAPSYTPGEASLIEAFKSALGLYQVSTVNNKLTDQFTIRGADGTAVSTITIDIESAGTPGSTSVTRQQTLTKGEKYKIYQYLDKKKTQSSISTIFVPDSVITPTLEEAYKDEKDLFKKETIQTTYGSVSIDEEGRWTYTQDTATTASLGSNTSLSPRISSTSAIKASLSDVDLDLSALAGGSIKWAEFQLGLLTTLGLTPIVKGLETKIPLDWSSTVKNILASLLEGSPNNAYVDGEVQVIEVLDSIYYSVSKFQQLKGGSVNIQKYIPLSPGIKAMGAWIRNAENILSLRNSNRSETNKLLKNKLFPALNEDPWKAKSLELNLDYKSDSPVDGSKWLNQAYTDYSYSTKKPIAKNTSPSKLDARDAQILYQRSKKQPVERQDMWAKGKSGGSASPTLGFDIDYSYPALLDPQKFVRDLLTGDTVTTSGFGLNLSLGLDLSWRQQIFPIFAAIFGFEVALKWALNWSSSYTQSEIILINENIMRIKNTQSLSAEEKEKKIDAYMSDILKRTMTDLKKEYFSASFGPYIAGELGIPLFNVTLKLGVTPKFTVTNERWVDGKLADNQLVNLKDYEDNPQSKRYGYSPKLESLTFHLEHNYDTLLSQGPKDATGYKTFKEAYANNTWLFNIGIKPLDLRNLIGKSKLSYDVSLLKKMETPEDPITGIKGMRDISKIEWVSIADPSLVTSGGIDFLFKEAKQLNSAVSKAFRSALGKQYPNLTEKELSRLLSLIVDNAEPTKIDYSLTDSKDIDGRIASMKKSYTVAGSRGMNENNFLERDVLRYHSDNADGHSVTDNYSYYKLATPKYITINPKLDAYNYVQIDLDLISTKGQLDAELQFYDGNDWQSIGRVNDNLTLRSDANNSRAAITLTKDLASIDLSFIEAKNAVQKAGDKTYIHNSGTLSVRLSLARMDDEDADPLEQKLLREAKAGSLQLRLHDTTTSGLNDNITYLGDVGIQRGGSIYSKSSDPSVSLRQDTPMSWGSQLDSGTVAWVAPTFFRPQSDRPDLDGLTKSNANDRTQAIKERLNPNLPISILAALEKLNTSSTSHLSNDQSGSLADAVQGDVRFTKDSVSQTTYKSYIGADRRVRVAARLNDDSDWMDIATIETGTTGGATLNLRPDETMAPDLVAINDEIMLASWDFQGNLRTYTLTKSSDTNRYSVTASNVETVRLSSETASGNELSNHLKSSDQYNSTPSNNNLRIGIEKRLDLSSSTSVQQAFYVSVLDPIRQVYGSSAKALKLKLPDYDTVSNTDTLGNLSNDWLATPAELTAHLKSLLGFGELSTSGVFSGAGHRASSGNVGAIKAADFIEYSSIDALSRHFGEWGSGSVFVAAANDANGEGMIWNYDGEAYYAKNKNRSVKETTTSSGRVYTLNGLDPDSVSVVYRILDQKDSLISNWQGTVDEKTAVYQQVSNLPIRTAANPETDSLIAGGNLAILAVGNAKVFSQYHQTVGTAAQIGAKEPNDYSYADGSLIARYISPQRFTGSDGVNYWYDASNVAPLSVEVINNPEDSDQAKTATATLNTGGAAGGIGWVWTPARQQSFGQAGLKDFDDLQTRTGLDFIDSNSLNLALMHPAALATSGQTLTLNGNSLQLLPTDQTPELFLDLSDGTKTVQRLSAKAGSLSEMGVVLTGAELLNASSPIEGRSPRSFDIIRSLFNGTRPYLGRGEYIPVGFYNQDGKVYYGNINAPVETTIAQSSVDHLFRTPNSNYPLTTATGKPANGYAIVPIGLEGTISDYINYGVDSGKGSELLKLIQTMPTVVPVGYFDFGGTTAESYDIGIGKITHVPMVPLRSSDPSKQLIVSDLTPWTESESNRLYRAGTKPLEVSLGRGEPDSVILEKLNLYSTYNKGNITLSGFVDYAWKDPQLKYDLLDKALPVSGFKDAQAWLKQFGTLYAGFDLQKGYSLVSGETPSLVNNTLFTPISRNTDTLGILDLAGKAPAVSDKIVRKVKYETNLGIDATLMAVIFPIPLFSTEIPLHTPIVTYKESYGPRKQGSGGPLTGSFSIYFDENRNLVQELAEPYSKTNPQSPTLDLIGSGDRMLLDTSEISNKVWDGKNYVVRYQDGSPDWRSGVLVIKPSSSNAVVDVMTGLVNSTTYLSRLEKDVADTHWETIKNSLLLDYVPYSFKDVEKVATGRWFVDRQALTKLVPEEIAAVFSQTFLLPAGLDADLSNPTSVYQGFIEAASSTQPNLLAQYKFETQMMVTQTIIEQIYAKQNIDRTQLASSNTSSGYDSNILAYQVIPYLAFSLAGKTDPYYKTLIGVICDAIGGARATQIKSGLATPGSIKLDLSNATDLALVLGFAKTTLPQTDFFQNNWSQGRLDLNGTTGAIKTELQQMKLLNVATSITSYLKAWETISAAQYAINPLLVTTAVSDLKREILKDGGVISKAVTGIVTKTAAGILPPTAWQSFKPLDSATFAQRNGQIQAEAALSQVRPGVAGIAKAQVVDQVFGDSDTGVYEFTLRLSRPAPNGGAVLLLGYQGSAVYGTDYTINGLSSQPQYLYVPSGETTQKVTIDVSKSKGVSSLLLQLQSSSGDYTISTGFNRMLFEIANGKAQILEQKDNVRSISGDQGQTLPSGENIFAVVQGPDPVTKQEPKLVGSQPNLVDTYQTVSTYVSVRNPEIIRYSTSAPSDSDILGGWTLQSKDLFRVFEGDSGPVDIVELKNTATGVYTYVNPNQANDLSSKGWVSNGIVFSLDYDRSLPLGITTARNAAPVGSVPNMSLAGIKGYLDTYSFATDQDISEWRFFASVKNLSFAFNNGNGDSGPITLNGDLMLRKRHEYTTDTFWLSANASGLALPSLASVPASNTATGYVDLRLSQEANQTAIIDQWRIRAAVKDYQFTNSLKLDGNIDLSYEKSAATNQKTRFALAANVKNLSFSEGGINLANLEANVKKLVLEDGQLTSLNLDATVKDLQIASQFKVTGLLGIEYSKSANKTSLKGNAEIKDFGLKIGDSGTISVTKGNIGFSVLNNKLETASLSIEEATINAGPQLAVTMASGSVELVQSNGIAKSLTVKASLANSNLGPLAITAASLELAYKHIDAVPVKNGAALPARDELRIDLSKTSGSLTLVENQSSIKFTDASANLLLVNGNLSTYNLSTGPLEMSLGDGINLSGSLSLKNEIIKENNNNTEYIYAYTYATGLSVDFEGFKLNGTGEVEATIRNKKLKTLHLAASITSLAYKNFEFAGYADLNLDDNDNNGSFETVTVSAGISELKLDLLGSTSQPVFSGEIENLVLVDGDIKSWNLTGGIDAFNVANLFTASGYASLSYNKTVSNSITKEQITGTLGISDFSLTLPGNTTNPTSATKAFGEISFDWYDNTLHQWKLSAGVSQLQLAPGFSISGDVSLEYQSANYDSDNPYNSAFYRLDASLEEAMITLQQGKDPLKVSGSLKNLVVTNDGAIHSWQLAASVKNLTLFTGFEVNGNLSLDYKRSIVDSTINETYSGWAEISQFSVATAGVSTDPGSSLNGKLAFTSVNGNLKDWTLTAKAKNLTVLDTFHIDGELEMSTTIGNPSLHSIQANIQELKFKVANKLDVTMVGQLDLSYKTPDGSIYAVEQDWKLKASRISMSVSDGVGGQIFSLDGDGSLSYQKKLKYDNSISVSEMEIENEDFTVSANVNNLKLKLPDAGNPDITLDLKGSLDANFDEGDLTKLSISSTVKNLSIKDFTLNGNLKLSYLSSKHQDNKAGEDTFNIDGDFNGLSLIMPTTGGNNALELGSGNVDFQYGSISGITAWSLEAKVNELTLFNAVTFSGSTGISYEKKTIQTSSISTTQEIYDFYATVTDLRLHAFNNQNLKLSGAFKLQSIDGTMKDWSLEASAKGLQFLGLGLDGQFNVAYALEDSTYNDQETLRISKASVSATGISGLLQEAKASLLISDVLIAKATTTSSAWTTISWSAKANIDIQGPDIPLELKASLNVDYLKYDTAHELQSTYTLNGEVSDFKIKSDLISLKNANLTLKNMVVVEGQGDPLGLSLQGTIEELSIAKLLKLSGNFLINYVNTTTKKINFEGNLTDLEIAGFDIFNQLGIASSKVEATYASNGDLSADVTITLAAGAHLKIGEFDLGLGGSQLSLKYKKDASNPSGTLTLAGDGNMTLGSTNIAVNGSFQASINLDTGAPSLDFLSLNLTPNGPANFGIFELNNTSISYQNGSINLDVGQTRVNARFLNQLASPIYNTIDTMAPALNPVVDLLTYQVPNEIETAEIAIEIPAIKIPTLVFTGWRSGLFGIKFPTFKTEWKEITPEIKTVIAPAIDIGTPLTSLLESYSGNPFQNGELEIIELIDGLGAVAFYVNQKLAAVGLGDAFEPYVAIYGNKAYSMDYPALAPIVGTIDTLLDLASAGKQTLTQEWLDLPAFEVDLNVASGDLDFNVDNNQDNVFSNLAGSIGPFGQLYSFVNTNNPIPSGPTAPVETPGTSSTLGFTDRSSLRVPILENPIKSILYFVLDKPLDLFEYNLDLTGSLKARASVDLGSWVAALIGVPIPLILGGNVGLTANLDTTVGFTASSKAIKDIATSVGNLFSNNNTGSFEDVYKSIVKGVTEANRGVYLDISEDFLTLQPEASVDLSLDYKVVGLRAQIGLATTLSAALQLLVQPPKLIDIKAWDTDTNDGGSSPTGEAVAKAFDGNKNSKYLNTGGQNSGFRLKLDKPGNFDTFTIVTGNDAPNRDPASVTIRARNSDTDNWTTLTTNQAITLPSGRNSESAAISFTNSGYYTQYEITFPTLRNSTSTLMQLSEFRFTPKVNSTAVNNSRIYLTNLIMPLFDPTFKNGKLANDLVLSLKPGPTTFWLDFLAKVASPWFSLLRLEAGTSGFVIKALGQTIGQIPGLPLPKISLDFPLGTVYTPLGTVYTGPTYGPTALNFGNDILLSGLQADADLLTDFRSGVADQKGFFDRIGAELASDAPRGFLTVATSPYSRDVLTAIPRALLLFDAVTDQDPTPDVLNVITSLDSTTALLAAHATTTGAAPLSGSILSRIAGFKDEMAGHQSSYALLGASSSAEQSQGRDKLIFEYQLQTVLLAIQDQLRSSNGLTAANLTLSSVDQTLPKDESLWPFILLHQYLAGLPSGSQLDLSNANSLKGLFTSIETTLATTGASAGSGAAGLLADLVQRLCGRISDIAQTSEAVDGSALLVPIALSGLKQLIQSHTFEGYLRDLRRLTGTSQAIQDRSELLIESFTRLMAMPRSAATDDRFATLGWAVDGASGQVSLSLDHASNELGAFANLWIDTTLQYGVDYRLKGYTNLPTHLVLNPASDHLDLEIEVINTNLSGSASVNLHLLASSAGIQLSNDARVLQVSITGTTATSTVASAGTTPLPLTGSHRILADSNGVFTLPGQSGPPYLLVDFDPLLGSRIDSSGTPFASDELRVIHGQLYAGTKAIGVVLSSTLNGRDLLSYADQLAPSTPDPDAGQTWRAQEQSMQEDQPLSLSLATLLSGLGLSGGAEVIHAAATPRLGVNLSGGTLTITPEADVNGKGSLVLSILDAGQLSTLVVPLNVVGSADAPVLLRATELSMQEDGSLTVPEGLLGSTIVDPDVFGDVQVLTLISDAGNSGDFTITHNSADQTFTIDPDADLHGSFKFDLQVKSSSGTYTIDKAFNLTVKPVDDLPEARGTLSGRLTGQSFLRVQDDVIPNGDPSKPEDRTLGLMDGDSVAETNEIAGIRITSYPASGQLRWQAAPPSDLSTLGSGDQPFDLITHGLVSLSDLQAGRLIYLPDNTTPTANRLSDLFTFVIVQQRNGTTIESLPCTFNIGDDQEDEKDVSINVTDPAIKAANEAYNASIKRPNVVSSSISFDKQADQVSLSISFDQVMSLEGGDVRVWLKDPTKPTEAPAPLTTISQANLNLSNDKKSLSINFDVPKDVEGLLSFDLTSRGDVLWNSEQISLTGDPDQFAVLVDTLPAQLISNSFSIKGQSILLNLEFSNPMVSTGHANLRYTNPYTGQISQITTLRPSTTPLPNQTAVASTTVTFDFGVLVNDLVLMPGETYHLTLDTSTGLKDPGDNGTNPGTISLDLKIPYPATDTFKDAETKAIAAGNAGDNLNLKPTTFYLTVKDSVSDAEDDAQVIIPFGLLPKGITVNAGTYNVSRLASPLSTDKTHNLSIRLLGDGADELFVRELELLFPRQEIRFDPSELDQLTALSSYSLSRHPSDASLGILNLRLKDGNTSLTPGSDQLLNLPFHSFPRSDGENQRDTIPALILRKVVGTQQVTGTQERAAIDTNTLNLPELLLSKSNDFVSNTPLAAIGEESYITTINSDPLEGDLFIRSLKGLKSTNGATISTAPTLGTVSLDRNRDLWIYTPNKDASGNDSFTIRVIDKVGNQIEHTVAITIKATTEKHALITANDEKVLAGKLSNNPDSNGDGKNDDTQSNIAVLPWRTNANFQLGDDANTDSLIRMLLPDSNEQIGSSSAALSTPNLNDDWEFKAIEVIDPSHPDFTGGTPSGVAGSWDPLSFSLTTSNSGNTPQTARVWIDLSSGNYPLSYFNGYRKYVSNDTIQDYLAAGLPLNDLTGKPIKTAGWYDFQQRRDANGIPMGEGARLITKDGLIRGIELTLKDNAFGDSDPTLGVIKDPGSLVLSPQIRLNPGQLSSSVTANITANGLPELQFLAAPGLASQFKVFATTASVNASGVISGASLTAGQNFSVEEITIDSDRSAYVIKFLDADSAKNDVQTFGTYHQGLATGNTAAVADGVYRISLSDNIQLGSFTLKTNQLSKAEYNRLSCFHIMSLKKNNYSYFSALHGYRNTNLPGNGDDILIGRSTDNLAINSRDTLNGLAGRDLLNGYGNRFDPNLDFNTNTNPISQYGLNQRDSLTGGLGRDTFQLADGIGAFYQGDGNQGYAVITDFSSEDSLILSGSASDYTLTTALTSKQSAVGIAGRALYLGDAQNGDLIAILQGSGSGSLQLSPSNPTLSQIHWL